MIVMLNDDENVKSSRDSQAGVPDILQSQDVNIEMLSDDQEAKRFSNNINKKGGRSPYFEATISPKKQEFEESSDKAYFDKRESLASSFLRQAACYEY